MTSPDQPLQTAIQQAFQALYNHTLAVVPLQNTKKEFEGTHTFVTFPYTSPLKKKPDEIAQEVGTYLIEQSNLIEDFNVVKGFLNLHLKDAIWIDIFQQIYKNPDFGQHPSLGKKVVVEYSSPNTNKPLHLGHLRNNFLGYAVAEILKLAGYDVHKTQIINDRGIHICKSMLAYQKFGQQETPASSSMKGDHLVGKYYVAFNKAYKAEVNTLIEQGVDKNTATKEAPILKEAQAMLQKWEDNDPTVVALWKKMNGWVYEGFNTTYEDIGVDFDSELHESETYLLGKDIIEQALEEGIFYKKENGSIWVDLQEEKLDEKLVLRADGTAVYMTQDIGTAELRYKSLGMDKMIYVVGNEQDWHFKVLFTILKKLGRSYAQDLHHLSYGMVDLPTGKMKSREGTVVDADELVAEVINIAKQRTLELGKIEELNEEEAQQLFRIIGLGALKYFLLKVDPKKRMLYNPMESIDFQGDTAPYIQYNYVRTASVKRTALQSGVSFNDQLEGYTALAPSEADLIRHLADFPKKIQEAADTLAPSVMAQYVYELTRLFSVFWTQVSILKAESTEARSFRIALADTVARTIKRGLQVLGIEVPEKM